MDAQPITLATGGRKLRWHPFDTAWGTLALGFLLTLVLAVALRTLSG